MYIIIESPPKSLGVDVNNFNINKIWIMRDIEMGCKYDVIRFKKKNSGFYEKWENYKICISPRKSFILG